MPPVWFTLVDCAGLPYKRTNAETVEIPDPNKDITVLRKAIYAECSALLDGILPLQLTVYKDKKDFDGNKDPLEVDRLIAGLGTSRGDALVILVPPPEGQSAAGGFSPSAHGPTVSVFCFLGAPIVLFGFPVVSLCVLVLALLSFLHAVIALASLCMQVLLYSIVSL
jgi:hypothetical protein